MASETEQPPDYIHDRLVEQRDWHSEKAIWNKHRHYATEIITLVAGALIPVVNVWAENFEYSGRVISAFLGGVIVVAVGIGRLLKFQENWLQYRAVAEAVEREQQLYHAGVGDYSTSDPAQRKALLVDRAEGLLATATTKFITTHRASSEGRQPPGPANEKEENAH